MLVAWICSSVPARARMHDPNVRGPVPSRFAANRCSWETRRQPGTARCYVVVTKYGTGTGLVTSDPPGIYCGDICRLSTAARAATASTAAAGRTSSGRGTASPRSSRAAPAARWLEPIASIISGASNAGCRRPRAGRTRRRRSAPALGSRRARRRGGGTAHAPGAPSVRQGLSLAQQTRRTRNRPAVAHDPRPSWR